MSELNFKDKFTGKDIDPNTAFLTELREKLPQFFTAEKRDEETGEIMQAAEFDIEKFKANLAKNNVNEIHDGYTLNYVGKTYARLQVGQPTPTVIIPDKAHNEEPENANSKNVFLTGDNLDVLKHLRNAYTGAVDFIYIDPPYNTGSDGFVYNDKFDLKDDDLRDTLGFSEDDIQRLHLLNGRSSHSAWLTFMYPRLKIAQQLLKDTGVIFVSIDDNEQANLKLLMDDVFGEGNFVGNFIWHKKLTGGYDNKNINIQHEYTFVYSKKYENDLLLGEKRESSYTLIDEHGKKYKWDSLWNIGGLTYSESLDYPITAPDGSDIWPIGEKGISFWLWSKEKVEKERDKLNFIQKPDGSWRVYKRIYASDETVVGSMLNPEIVRGNTNSSSEIKNLFDSKKVFDYPKPTSLIKYYLERVSQDSLILDFFAGSATTADAVMQLNAEDGGHRQFILATLDEEAKSEVAKNAGYKTIDEISRERIKRAAAKIREENPLTTSEQDFGFKHFYVKDIDAQTIDKLIDFDPNDLRLIADDMVGEFGKPFTTLAGNEITTGATGEETILQTWLVDDGYKFDQKVETIELSAHSAFHVENLLYIISPIDQEDIKTLLNRIGEHQLNVATIIVFGYSLDFHTLTSLKNNVKTALDGVKVEVRY